MIKDYPPNKIVKWIAANIVERWVLRHFSSIKFIGELDVAKDRSCLMLMNHYSYNDGAILHRVCRSVLKKEFKAMSVASQLKIFPLLKYVGCFPIDRKSRKMIESLNYAAGLLRDPSIMLGLYPQAGMYSMHLNKMHFGSGLNYIFKRTKETPFQVFFGVTLLDYLENFKPVARVYFMEYKGINEVEEMEKAYNQFYSECKRKQQHLFNPPERVIDEVKNF
jgi:1-acyl-sn-glycerol-3-phosphate acyltransferase